MGVKNTWIAGEKGYDAGKKVSGIKRHTETLDKVTNILCDGGYTCLIRLGSDLEIP